MTELGSRLPATASGTHRAAFGASEWGLLAVAAAIWGCSFLFIAIALDDLAPGVVTAGRIGLGALVLAFVPAARRPVTRRHWPRIALLGVTWMAVPFTCFSLAEQWISSSLAGMLNAAVPLTTAIVATVLLRRLPPGRQVVGLLVGFAGVGAVMAPSLADDLSASAGGVALVALAVTCYGLATNLAVPLQQEYGALPVLLRVQLAALVLTAPFALAGLGDSTFAAGSFTALVALGALGTGLAFVAGATLLGRVGASRGAVMVYFVPIVSIAVGVAFRDETVAAVSLAGMVLVLGGAWLATRAEE